MGVPGKRGKLSTVRSRLHSWRYQFLLHTTLQVTDIGRGSATADTGRVRTFVPKPKRVPGQAVLNIERQGTAAQHDGAGRKRARMPMRRS